MPDWLHTSLTNGLDVSPWMLAWRLGTALVLGGVVVGIYRWARRGEPVAPTFLTTLALLSTVIAMATQVIGDNVARAFSLVGALSVVRFRTVVKDTQDTAFVIFAVVVGMAAGASHLALALVGLGLMIAASPVLWPRPRRSGWAGPNVTLEIRVHPAEGVELTIEGVLHRHVHGWDLKSAATSRKGEVLELVYLVRLRPDASPTALVAELIGMDGVQGADLRRGD